jgi:flagellar biosynthesis protein FlhG
MTGSHGPAPRTICISSGKGGVGKTSFSVNLAAALAQQGRKVLLIDGDLGLANVDVLLGLTTRRNLQRTVEEGIDPAALLVEVFPGLQILPASSGVPEMANLSAQEQALLGTALEPLLDRFDFVLVDTAAGLGDSVLWFNDWARENIVIVSPDPTSLTDAYALIKVLRGRFAKERFDLLINSARTRKEADETFATMRAVLVRFLNLEPRRLGDVPQDAAVARAVRQQKPFLLTDPGCRAGKAVTAVAARLLGEGDAAFQAAD